MKLYYDFHIHSCLSPCASDDMTPNNIVGMAQLKGLQAIAITDHNSCKNAAAVMACARAAGLLCLPGMELETREEVHMLCLFPALASLYAFADVVDSHMPPIQNRADIFGEQLILNECDEVVGRQENLLITASDLAMEDAVETCRSCGGVILPAHVDREANSMLTNLGFVAPELAFPAIEISRHTTPDAFLADHLELSCYPVLRNSDAHYLEDISEAENALEVSGYDAVSVLRAIGEKLV